MEFKSRFTQSETSAVNCETLFGEIKYKTSLTKIVIGLHT